MGQPNASFAHKPNKTLQEIFTKTKTPIEKIKQNNVVYEVPCKQCDQIYIGTTKRSLEKRIQEHKADVDKNKETTALSQHMKEKNHTPDFDNTKILNKEKFESKRYTIESLRIQEKLKRTMNTKEDKDNTHCSYLVAINST